MPNNALNPSPPGDPQEEAVRGVLKDHQEKVRVALAGLAAAHTQTMQQTPNRSWLMHYYDDLLDHSWDPFGQIAQLAQAQGRRVVGTFCVFAPDELIYAAGGLPIRLDAGADEAIAKGEQELGTVNLCPVIKSSMGLKRLNLPFAGEAGLDLVIIPSVCDGKKKLVDFFSRYVPSWMIQVPHTSLDPRVRDYWRTEIRLLRENLESFTGHKIKPKELAEAIRTFNRKRRALRRLYELRRVPNPPITGRDAMLVAATFNHDDPVRWAEQTERLCLELEEHVRRGIGVGRLVVYLVVGAVLFTISASLQEAGLWDWMGRNSLWATATRLVLAVLIILYGVSVVFGWPRVSWCQTFFHGQRQRPLLSMLMGVLTGSILCPALWRAFLYVTRLSWLPEAGLALLAFWVGSSLIVILTGVSAGAMLSRWKNLTQVRGIAGATLIFVGALYLI